VNFLLSSFLTSSSLVQDPSPLATEPTSSITNPSELSWDPSALITLAALAGGVALGVLGYISCNMSYPTDERALQPLTSKADIPLNSISRQQDSLRWRGRAIDRIPLPGSGRVGLLDRDDELVGWQELPKGNSATPPSIIFSASLAPALGLSSRLDIARNVTLGGGVLSQRISPQPKGDLTKAVKDGCDAAEFLAIATCKTADRCNQILQTLLQLGVVDIQRIPKMKMKKKEFEAMISRNPFYASMPINDRFSYYIKFVCFYNSATDPERYLKRLYDQFSLLIQGSKATLESIKRKTEECTRSRSLRLDPRLIQLSLISEYFEEIQNLRNLLLRYLEEIGPALADAALSMGLMEDLVFFQEDTTSDFKLAVTEGVRVAVEKYRKDHPHLPKKMTCVIKDRERQVALIEEGHRLLKMINQQSEKAYLERFNYLLELIEKGIITKQGEIRVPAAAAVSSPSTSGGAIEIAPELDPLSEEKCLLPQESRIPRGAEEVTISAASTPLNDFSIRLQKIVPLQTFRVPSAQEAYVGALDYVKCLHLLLTLPQGALVHPHELAQFQMDIGYSGYHALEQLITAMMLEKGKEKGSDASGAKAVLTRTGDDKALFNEVGHSLISRMLFAGISPPEDVAPVLREVNGMEFAIRDLGKGWKTHFLLKNTQALLSSTESCPSVSLDIEAERSKATVFGQRVLQASVSLLLTHASARGSRVDPDPYFEAIALIIPESMARPGGAGASKVAEAPLPVKRGKVAIEPAKKAIAASSDFPQLAEIFRIINLALEKSNDYENASLRKSTIQHNLHRCRYLLSCLSNPLKLPLFPFYANQGRFVLRTIVEEFLCAAQESVHHKKGLGAVDQKLLAHKLYDLAQELRVPLDSDQRIFLQRVPTIRNEARYDGHRLRASAGASAVSGSTFMPAEEFEDVPAPGESGMKEGFTMALGSRYQGIERELQQDLRIVVGLCTKISSLLFRR
jgi:hypothetical protein